MQRRLVLTNEAARHPFRIMLPPAALRLEPAPRRRIAWWRREDTHLFALSFWAFFTAFYSFIA